MRKFTVPVAVAMVAALSPPAHAGKYGCSFFNGLGVIHQCDIDSATSGPASSCQKIYNRSVTGTCRVTKSGENGASDRLECAFGSPTKSVAELMGDATKADAKAPGFMAGGVTLGAPAGLVLTVGYRASRTAPLFKALCASQVK